MTRRPLGVSRQVIAVSRQDAGRSSLAEVLMAAKAMLSRQRRQLLLTGRRRLPLVKRRLRERRHLPSE